MRIGTMFCGTVESLGNESVQTKFFVLGVPIIPMSSHYVLSESFNGISGFDIPLHGKSVGLGYLRTASWLVALICGLFYWLDDSRKYGYGDGGRGLLAWTIGAGLVAIVSTFVLGRLSKAEKVRRSMLQLLTGVGAPPEWLPEDARASIREKLVEASRESLGERLWDREIENGRGDPLLFVLAEYHGRPDLARAALANMGSQPTSTGPYR